METVVQEFGVQKIRKQNNFIEIFFLIASVVYALFKMQDPDEAHKMAMEIVVAAVVFFGFGVKFLLNLLFPQIILNKEGIKFLENSTINWKQIRKITVTEDSSDVITIVVEKSNNKKQTQTFKNLSIKKDEIEIILNEYLKKFGYRNLQSV